MTESELAQRHLRLFEGKTLDEILVPVVGTDHYERGAALATRFAHAWNLPMRLVHVHQPGEQDAAQLAVAETTTRNLAAAHPEVVVEGIEIEGGNIGQTIRRATSDGSLLTLATNHATQWAGNTSVAEEITRASSGPVLMFGPNCDEVTVAGTVIVALDGSNRAEEALRYGAGLAAALGAMLWVVQVVDAATVRHVQHLKAGGEKVSESAYLRSVAERLEHADLRVGWEIIHADDPVVALTAFARDRSAALIVAATHGESGLPRTLFGSVCMGLVERGAMPVLVVKTAGAEAELDSEPSEA